MKFCRDCREAIDWMQTETGHYVPVNPEPVYVIEGEGLDSFFTDEGAMITGREARPEEVLTHKNISCTPLGFVPHWRTCRRGRTP